MSNDNAINVYIISDSLGETGNNLAQAAIVQFPKADFKVHRYPLIKTVSILTGILHKATRENAIIVHTFSDSELSSLQMTTAKKTILQSSMR